jgi:hypothetical protein
MVKLFDKVEFSTSQRKYTDEGYLIVPAYIARSGMYQYKAGEVGFTDRDPEEIVNIYRPPEEVFNDESMQSFACKPVTNNHPRELVTIDNIKKYSVGMAGMNVEKDEDKLKTVLTITDKCTIKQIEDGKCEISNGYTADIDIEEGYADAVKYDGVQRKIKGNHIAVVEKGRAGSAIKIADNEPTNNNKESLMKIKLYDIEFEVSDQVATVVEKLKDEKSQLTKTIKAKDADHAKAMTDAKSDSQKEVDTLKAQLDDAKSKIVSDADLDAKVAARVALVEDAKALVKDFDATGKSNKDIVKEVVIKCCDDMKDREESEDYMKARFDGLKVAIDKKPDGADKLHIEAKDAKDVDEGEDARKKFVDASESAWKKNAGLEG